MSFRSPLVGRAVRIVLIAAASGLVAALALVALVGAGWTPALAGPLADGAWTARSRAWFTIRGVHAAEIRDDNRHYTWTGPSVRFVIPHLDRTVPYTLRFIASASRPDAVPLPTLSWSVDGVRGGPLPVANQFGNYSIPIPIGDDDRVVVTLQVSDAWDPGPDDERLLGIHVREVALETASGRVRPQWTVLAALAFSVALVVLPLWISGMTGALALVGSLVVIGAFTSLTWLDGAFLGPFPEALGGVAVVSAALSLGVAAVLALARRGQGTGFGAAVALVIAATTIKLAIFSHPLALIGDGVFQVHRAQMVSAGQYFFTSITPRPFFEFPYAIGLYVAALPFWSWVPRELDRVWLLRVVALSADGLVGVALYAVARRAWASPVAALYVAGLWPFARAPFEALSNANLTNAFGQSVFGLAMAGLGWSVAGGRFAWSVGAVSTAVLTAAFLSHFSTLSVGIPLVGLVAMVMMLAGRAGDRTKGFWILAMLVLAMAVSYAAYYRHFGAVYQQTIDRVMAQQPVDTQGSSIAASPLIKLRRWATGGSDDYGLPGAPLAVAAILGVVGLARARRREPWTLVVAGWLVTWIGFTAIGILSSVQMRVNLAAAPLFVCLGAYALGAMHERSAAYRIAALGLAALVAWDGVRLWLVCLGL